MYDSLIFDMDGTLVNFINEMVVAWNDIFKKHGWNKTVNYDDVKMVMGLQCLEIGKLYFPGVEEKQATFRAESAFLEELPYLEKMGGITYVPNEKFLIELSKKYKLYIISNCLNGYIEMFLKKYHFEKYFIDFVDSSTGKSKAQNIVDLVKKHNLHNPAYVGDTIKDYNSALEANVDFIFASYGFGDVKNTKSIGKLEDLLSIE